MDGVPVPVQAVQKDGPRCVKQGDREWNLVANFENVFEYRV